MESSPEEERINVTLKAGTPEHEIYFSFIENLVAKRETMKRPDIIRFFIKQYPEIEKLRKRVAELEEELKMLHSRSGNK